MPSMLDLFAGRGGASRAMRERGWDVVTVDLDPQFGTDVVADVRTYTPDRYFDLIWGSPPCDEFARESMPWCKTGRVPSIELVLATTALIDRSPHSFDVIENVRGSVRWLRPVLGPPLLVSPPIYLWGHLPGVLLPRVAPFKERITGKRKDLRAVIPYEISLAIARAVERAVDTRGAA